MKSTIKPAQVVRLKPELWEAIDNQAEKEERSRNKMIELLIRKGLTEWGTVDTKTGITKPTNGAISFDPNKMKL